MITRTDTQVEIMAKAGARLSKVCRCPFTGERRLTCVKMLEVPAGAHLIGILNLPGKPLLDFADVADLDQIFYLGAQDQHAWDEARWRKEIEDRVRVIEDTWKGWD